MKTFSWFAGVLVLITVFVSSGCMVGQFYRLGPQSHFAYPNSNVKALGPVKVKTQTKASVMPQLTTGDNDEMVFNQAIAQVAGANIILDYVRCSTVYKWPGLPIYWTDEEIEATAGQMEVGQQGLR
jgi:hypothetical protein